MMFEKLQVPKIYRNYDGSNVNSKSSDDCNAIKPYFPASHPNTMWIINKIRSADATPLVKALKSSEKMNIFFKYSYFQILDKPSLYDSSRALDQPMFNEKAYLFLNIFAIALYLRSEAMVRVLAPMKVKKIDNSSGYDPLSDVSVVQYAAYVHDHSQGDLLTFTLPILLMRREAYFAIPHMFRYGAWKPMDALIITYNRRNYHCTRNFKDWLEYAWTLVDERPHIKISSLLVAMNKSASKLFYIGKKVEYQPINCRYYTARNIQSSLDQRAVIVYRSYPRRVLCKLFLHKEPLRVMPQIIPFIRVFQSERFFVAQTAQALNPEFRMVIQSSLEERLINISPICNSDKVNASEYKENNSHKLSIYDFDNILALLLHFLVMASDRNVNSLRNSIIKLIMDIMIDTNLLYIFSKEPAVNISYYLSFLVDGPFIQPNDLQHMLKNIPILLLQKSTPDKYFPPFLLTSKSKFDKQQQEGYELFNEKLPIIWKKGNFKKAVQCMMRYRVDIDEKANVTTLDYCEWKNHYLEKRLRLNLQTIGQSQQIVEAKYPNQRMTVDDDGLSHAQGWKAMPHNFMQLGKQFLVTKQEDKTARAKKNFIDAWTFQQLDIQN